MNVGQSDNIRDRFTSRTLRETFYLNNSELGSAVCLGQVENIWQKNASRTIHNNNNDNNNNKQFYLEYSGNIPLANHIRRKY